MRAPGQRLPLIPQIRPRTLMARQLLIPVNTVTEHQPDLVRIQKSRPTIRATTVPRRPTLDRISATTNVMPSSKYSALV